MQNIIYVFSAIAVFTLLFSVIATMEKGDGVNKLYEKSSKLFNAAIAYFFIILLCLYVLNNSLKNNENQQTILIVVVVVIKFIMAFYVSKEAVKQNRNSTLWFILGFIEFHAGLIALGIGKTIYKLPKNERTEILNLNKKTIEKIEAFKSLKEKFKKQPDLATRQREYDIPLNKMKREYGLEFDELFNSIKHFGNKKLENEKLERAFKAGAISEEEFNSKIKKE